MADMKKIESEFNKEFSYWDIRLPADDIAQRRRGKIAKEGWAIWYLFGTDEKGEYLDYYASHRMTNDRHERIYSDGRRGLPSLNDMREASKDPEEDARLQAEFYDRNQKIAAMLEEKGFGIEGDEPGGVQINRSLKINKIDK